MAEKGSDPERMEEPSRNPMPSEWAERGKVRIEEFAAIQAELFDKFQEANRQWLDRAQSEAICVSQFLSKMTAARSFPEAMAAYQEWAACEFEMIAQDGKRFLDNTEKLIVAGTRLLSGDLYATFRPAM